MKKNSNYAQTTFFVKENESSQVSIYLNTGREVKCRYIKKFEISPLHFEFLNEIK